jgi:DNA-directed RNA polymerase subunit RPC12/RpoP
MAYKCLKCGITFNEPSETSEFRGFVGGDYAYENINRCPRCGGTFKEMRVCARCGEEHLSEELIGGVCRACIDDKRKDFVSIYDIAIGETATVEINALIASLLDAADINQILYDHIRRNMSGVDCSAFIDDDIDFIGEGIAEGRDKL